MDDSLRFRIEEDDQVRFVDVPFTFDDVPVDVALSLMLLPSERRLAGLLAWRLSIPFEAAERLVDELKQGEGVEVY